MDGSDESDSDDDFAAFLAAGGADGAKVNLDDDEDGDAAAPVRGASREPSPSLSKSNRSRSRSPRGNKFKIAFKTTTVNGGSAPSDKREVNVINERKEGQFFVGDMVELHRVKEEDLEGCKGKIVREVGGGEKFCVDLGRNGKVNVRPKYLILLEDGPAKSRSMSRRNSRTRTPQRSNGDARGRRSRDRSRGRSKDRDRDRDRRRDRDRDNRDRDRDRDRKDKRDKGFDMLDGGYDLEEEARRNAKQQEKQDKDRQKQRLKKFQELKERQAEELKVTRATQKVGWFPDGQRCGKCGKIKGQDDGVICGRVRPDGKVVGCHEAICWKCMKSMSKREAGGIKCSRAEFEDLAADGTEPWWMHEKCMEPRDLKDYYGEDPEEAEVEPPKKVRNEEDGDDDQMNFAWA